MAKPGAEPMSLLKCAALRAFKNLTTTQCKQLIERAPLPVSRPYPRRELDLIMSCIFAVCPDLDEAEIEAIVKQHRGCKTAQSVWACARNSTNLEHIDGLLDADEAKEVRDKVHQKEVHAAVSAGKRVVANKGPRKPRKMVVPEEPTFTKEQVAELLPQVRGCSINKDTALHGRWKVRYPCDASPFRCSKVWNRERSEREAFFFGLCWAWSAHLQKTGEPCPFELGA